MQAQTQPRKSSEGSCFIIFALSIVHISRVTRYITYALCVFVPGSVIQRRKDKDSDEGLRLETSVFESFYGGLFASMTLWLITYFSA